MGLVTKRRDNADIVKVVVGGITGHNVRAAVIDGDYPTEILLGTSFLRQVGMQEEGGVLTLVQKH